MTIPTCARCAIVSTLLLLTLAGCAGHRPAMRGGSNTSATGAGIGMMDAEMAAMCHDLYQEMAGASTAQPRQAIMRESTRSMTPPMRRSMEQNIGAHRCH
jgi:hypothetical protein